MGPPLQFVFVKNVHSGLCNVKTGVISGGGISSSQIKIDIAFPTQTTEQGSDGGVLNAILIHALYGERLMRRTKQHGVEWNRSKLQTFRTSANA